MSWASLATPDALDDYCASRCKRDLSSSHGCHPHPDQRARVFVSSTLGELAVERAAVREAVARLHLVPVLFESGARPYPAAFDHRLSRRPRSSNLLPNHN